MGLQIYDERVPELTMVQFVQADGTAAKTALTAPVAGSRIDLISAINTGAGAHTVQTLINVGGTDYLVGQVVVAAGSGVAGVAPVDILAGLGPTATFGIVLPSAAILKFSITVAMGAAESLQVLVEGGHF